MLCTILQAFRRVTDFRAASQCSAIRPTPSSTSKTSSYTETMMAAITKVDDNEQRDDPVPAACLTIQQGNLIIPFYETSFQRLYKALSPSTPRVDPDLNERFESYLQIYYLCKEGLIINLKNYFPMMSGSSVTIREIASDLSWMIRGALGKFPVTSEDITSWCFNRDILMNSFWFYKSGLSYSNEFQGFYKKVGCQVYSRRSRKAHKAEYQQLESLLKRLKVISKGEKSRQKLRLDCFDPAAFYYDCPKNLTPVAEFTVVDGRLNCILTQAPWNLDAASVNIASFSLLCCLLAQVSFTRFHY